MLRLYSQSRLTRLNEIPKTFIPLLLWLIILLFSGCSATHYSPDVNQVFSGQFTPAPFEVETPENVFAVSSDMQEFLQQHAATAREPKAKVQALVDALLKDSEFRIDYQYQANTTAADTFSAGVANCLSFTIMMGAMLDEIGVAYDFQEVVIPEYWTPLDGISLINRHINIRVHGTRSSRLNIFEEQGFVIDIIPYDPPKHALTRSMSKAELVSHYYTNVGADFIIKNELTTASAYLSSALEIYPRNLGGWLNLGVLLSRQERFDLAEIANKTALAVDPDYLSAKENLAFVYRRTNRNAEAVTIEKALHRKRIANPFYHLYLAQLASQNEEWQVALEHLSNAEKINRDLHEIHFEYARVYAALGNINEVRSSLKEASDASQDIGVQSRYLAKLALLRD